MSRIRANQIVNQNNNGAPVFPKGAVINGISTITADVSLNTSQLNGVDANFSGITTTTQLNVGAGGTVITTTSGGNVGINSSSPERRLDVVDSGASGSVIRSRVTTNNGGYLAYEALNSSGTSVFSVTHNGRINLSDNIVFASGQGLDFSATADGSGTTTSELLDDYEEGTWTPTASNYGGTMQVNSSSYVKVGKLCYIHAYVSFSNTTDGDDIRIDGLPFTPNGINNNYYPISAHTNGGLEELHLRAQGTTTEMAAVYLSAGNGDSKPSYTSLASKFIIFGGCYRTT